MPHCNSVIFGLTKSDSILSNSLKEKKKKERKNKTPKQQEKQEGVFQNFEASCNNCNSAWIVYEILWDIYSCPLNDN